MTQAGQDVITLTTPGWRPRKGMIEETTAKLKETMEEIKQLGRRATVTFHILDKVCFFSSSEEDGLTPSHRGTDRKYHILGNLVVTPMVQLVPSLRLILPLLEAAEGSPRYLLTPLPRYMFSPCCAAADHCANIGEPNYKLEQLSSLVALWKEIRGFMHRNNSSRGCTVLNPLWLLGNGERMETEDVLEAANSVWEDADPIHMNGEGYFRLAAGLLAYTRAAERGKSVSSSAKRKQESPAGPASKKPRVSDAGYVRALGASLRGGGGHGRNRGQDTKRGGGWPRGSTCSFNFVHGGYRGGHSGGRGSRPHRRGY
jgi:hypothetical protein